MSMKMRFVALGLLTVVIAGAWFFAAFRPAQSRLEEVRADVQRTQDEIAQLEAKLRRLQELKANEAQLRADVERFDTALPVEPAVSDFVRQVEDAGNQAGVDFLSVSPSLPASASGSSGDATAVPSGLQAVSVSLTANGTFFAIQQFVHNLEGLQRAIRVDDFSLSASQQESGTPQISLSIRLQMFMKPQPVAAPSEG